jgi:hypothetical protein
MTSSVSHSDATGYAISHRCAFHFVFWGELVATNLETSQRKAERALLGCEVEDETILVEGIS